VQDWRAVMRDGRVTGTQQGPYNVTVMLQGVGVREMNAGAAQRRCCLGWLAPGLCALPGSACDPASSCCCPHLPRAGLPARSSSPLPSKQLSLSWCAGPAPVIGLSDTLPKPGKFVLELPVPRTRATATVHVDVVDAFGVHYVDEFSLSFHVHFYKLLKYLIALPLLAMGAVVLLLPLGGASSADLRKAYHLG